MGFFQRDRGKEGCCPVTHAAELTVQEPRSCRHVCFLVLGGNIGRWEGGFLCPMHAPPSLKNAIVQLAKQPDKDYS